MNTIDKVYAAARDCQYFLAGHVRVPGHDQALITAAKNMASRIEMLADRHSNENAPWRTIEKMARAIIILLETTTAENDADWRPVGDAYESAGFIDQEAGRAADAITRAAIASPNDYPPHEGAMA